MVAQEPQELTSRDNKSGKISSLAQVAFPCRSMSDKANVCISVKALAVVSNLKPLFLRFEPILVSSEPCYR